MQSPTIAQLIEFHEEQIAKLQVFQKSAKKMLGLVDTSKEPSEDTAPSVKKDWTQEIIAVIKENGGEVEAASLTKTLTEISPSYLSNLLAKAKKAKLIQNPRRGVWAVKED